MICGWLHVAEKIEYDLECTYDDLKVRSEGYFKDEGELKNRKGLSGTENVWTKFSGKNW